MRYFVTGATGFLGGALVRQLRAAGHDVVALVRDPTRAGGLAGLGCTLAPGDITEPATLEAPMRGVDGLFHCAAVYTMRALDRAFAERVNVDGTRNVLRAMKAARVPKGVYTSTVAIFSSTRGRVVDESHEYSGPWVNEYERTKWKAHVEVARPMVRDGLPLVILLPGAIYGPGDHSMVGGMLDGFLAGKLPALPERFANSWSHVDDIARAHVLAMQKGRPGEEYIVAGPRHTVGEFIEIAGRVTGRPARPRLLPPWLFRTGAALASVVETVTAMPPGYSSSELRFVAETTYLASSEKARRELGWEPRPVAEGLRYLNAEFGTGSAD